VGKSTWRRTGKTQQDTGGVRGREHGARQRNEEQKNSNKQKANWTEIGSSTKSRRKKKHKDIERKSEMQ